MKNTILLLTAVALLCTTCSNSSDKDLQPSKSDTKAEVGKALPAWSEGELDIHLINTGRGECCFYILPDGTTLLVDAGEITQEKDYPIAQKPSNSVRPYITYAQYIKHFMPKGRQSIDYCAPSHLHIDHIGAADAVTETSPAGYRKAGLLALYDEVPYNHILDRLYPTYAEDEVTPPLSGQLSEDWAKFVTWGVKEKRFTAERFTPGKEQIVLRYNSEQYSNFSLLNICANGFVVCKNSDGSVGITGKKPSTGGNPASCGFHIRYGKFDYIACGDLTSSPQNLVAFYFRDFIGCGNLDAFKCHHHLASNSWGSQMQNCNFDPRVVLGHCFASTKPHAEKLAAILPIIEDFFATNIHPDIEAENRELISKISGYNGHIVLRVAPGGENFTVYMLDDSNFIHTVKSAKTYSCK
ncbi:MAG: MBL fold metallo-hydrolase [Alistipes sp.]|nr:MBL fold metallo-hydrolase [Alistipes sp.]